SSFVVGHDDSAKWRGETVRLGDHPDAGFARAACRVHDGPANALRINPGGGCKRSIERSCGGDRDDRRQGNRGRRGTPVHKRRPSSVGMTNTRSSTATVPEDGADILMCQARASRGGKRRVDSQLVTTRDSRRSRDGDAHATVIASTIMLAPSKTVDRAW